MPIQCLTTLLKDGPTSNQHWCLLDRARQARSQEGGGGVGGVGRPPFLGRGPLFHANYFALSLTTITIILTLTVRGSPDCKSYCGTSVTDAWLTLN